MDVNITDETNIKLPYTLFALRKASSILEPGGDLIMDNHPFFLLRHLTDHTDIQNNTPFSLVLGVKEFSDIIIALYLKSIQVSDYNFRHPGFESFNP